MAETGKLEGGEGGEERRRRSYWIVLLIFLPFLVLAVLYVKVSLQLIFVHNDVGYPEGASVYAFLTALRTGKLYSPPFDFPFNAQMYGPVFYLVGLAFAKVAHGDPMLATELCRLVSFLSFLGSAAIAGYLSWLLEGNRRWAAASVVLGLACFWAMPLFASVRPDELSIVLMLAALAVYQTARGRSRFVFWAGVLASLSWLTKQNTIPVVFAFLIDSLIARRLRSTAALIAGSAPIPGLVLLAMWLRGEPFLTSLLFAGRSIYDWPVVGRACQSYAYQSDGDRSNFTSLAGGWIELEKGKVPSYSACGRLELARQRGYAR